MNLLRSFSANTKIIWFNDIDQTTKLYRKSIFWSFPTDEPLLHKGYITHRFHLYHVHSVILKLPGSACKVKDGNWQCKSCQDEQELAATWSHWMWTEDPLSLSQPIWAPSWENLSYAICQLRCRSACSIAQSDQSLRCQHEGSWSP